MLTSRVHRHRYMAAYSMIQFASVLILYSIGAILGNWQFLYIDLFLVLPLAFISVYTGPHHKLSKRRPVCTLLSREVLVSLLSQTLVNVMFQVVAFLSLRMQPWYTPLVPNPDINNIVCPETSAVFLVANLQYISSVAAFSSGKPFRQPVFRNCTSQPCSRSLYEAGAEADPHNHQTCSRDS